MKIQYLAVIFIIIIMPIIIVFSEYLSTQVNIVELEQIYDERLFDSTHDSINAFQINTINSMYYTPQSRVKNIEAAVNTFFNSLVTSFQFDGNLSSAMKSYVPAVVFTMYDGYYIYAPFYNTLTEVKTKDEKGNDLIDEEYPNNKVLSGLKPYVSYSCKYQKNNKTYIINYSMDNYVYVDIFDGSKHESHGGYLINGITKSGNSYIYDGVTFSKNQNEKLNEFLWIDDNNKKNYYYTKIDGTKYYYDDNNTTNDTNDDFIFYVDELQEKHKQVVSKLNNESKFNSYYERIMNNNSAYWYYKDAYDFTTWLLEDGKSVDIDGDGILDSGQNLKELRVEDIVGSRIEGDVIKKENNQYQFDNYEFASAGKIFDGNIQYSNSNFNRHRADVIRAVITTNLSTAISSYGFYTNSNNIEYVMPKISERDWDLLENNICIATFLQGIKVGDKTYNNYSVIPNNFNKEYVDEDDIYVLTTDYTYTRVNDKILKDNSKIPSKDSLGFEPGILKINFEKRLNKDTKYYNPITLKNKLYLQSYTNLAGGSEIESIEKIDMYRYISKCSERLKTVYYTALGRERYGSFKYTINDIEGIAKINTINLNSNGINIGTVQKEIDGKIGSLPTPTRAGFEFKGWWTTPAGDKNVNVNGGRLYTNQPNASVKIIPRDDEENTRYYNANDIGEVDISGLVENYDELEIYINGYYTLAISWYDNVWHSELSKYGKKGICITSDTNVPSTKTTYYALWKKK